MHPNEPAFPRDVSRISSVAVDGASHHYIVLSQLHSWIEFVAAPYVSGKLLDYGCGGQHYRRLLETRYSAYVGADVVPAAGVALDIEILPDQPLGLAAESFDAVLSTQTIEHVYDFQAYLDDCSRLLRSGGIMVLTAPMQWRHHEVPFDYWRFTRYGLERALRAKGFRVVRMDPCGRVYSLIGQIFLSHISENRRPSKWLARAINRFAIWMDQRCVDNDDTLLWMCVARKDTSDHGQ